MWLTRTTFNRSPHQLLLRSLQRKSSASTHSFTHSRTSMSHRKTLSNEANFWQDFFFFFNVFLTLGLHNNNKLGKIRVAPLSSSSETTAAAAKCSHFCRTLLRTRLTDLAVAAVSYKVFPFTPLLLPSSFFLSPYLLLPHFFSHISSHQSPLQQEEGGEEGGKAKQGKAKRRWWWWLICILSS